MCIRTAGKVHTDYNSRFARQMPDTMKHRHTGGSTNDPLHRFTDRAELYARCRPDYPAVAIDYVLQHCGLVPGSILVDVGSGTGIASRQFAERGIRVIGIEPNAEMRMRAQNVPMEAGSLKPEFREGTAEVTQIPDATADGVLAAQAFHWFRAEQALQEFHRILRPAGWAVLMWNERDASDPFTAAYGAALQAAPNAAEIEKNRAHAGDALLQSKLFTSGELVLFKHSQRLDIDGVLGRLFSTSYAPRDPVAAKALEESVRAVFDQHERDELVDLCYDTSVYVAERV